METEKGHAMKALRSKRVKWRADRSGVALATCLGWRLAAYQSRPDEWLWDARFPEVNGIISGDSVGSLRQAKRDAEDFISAVEAGVLMKNS